jgi:hypothetical protein
VSAKVPETAGRASFPGSSFKYSPLRHVRVLFVTFVQGLFKASPKNCYHWSEDDEDTEIVISNSNSLDPDVLGKRPAITFTRGPIQFYSLGIDDRVSYDFTTDQKHKGVLVPGTMTINCLSRVELEAEDLAWVVAEHVWLLRDLLMKQGFFEIGRQPQIGSPSPAGSIIANDMGDEYTAVPITVPFQFARDSKFTPLGKQIVGSIQQQLTLATPKTFLSAGAPFHNNEIPVNIAECPPPSFAPAASDARGGTPDPGGRKSPPFLSKQPHPLDASKTVTVRTVRPFRHGLRVPVPGQVPITDPCVEESS